MILQHRVRSALGAFRNPPIPEPEPENDEDACPVWCKRTTGHEGRCSWA